MDSQITQRVRLPKGRDPERRGCVRFPLNLEVRYSVVGHRGPVGNGSGRTIDMSSSGLRFTADTPLPRRLRLDMSIDWPVLLDGGVQLQLFVRCVVVRSDGADIALRIERHEFRTRRAELRVVTRQEWVG